MDSGSYKAGLHEQNGMLPFAEARRRAAEQDSVLKQSHDAMRLSPRSSFFLALARRLLLSKEVDISCPKAMKI